MRMTKINKGPIKATSTRRNRVTLAGIPRGTPSEADFRILEDNDFRITENGDFRILQ